MTSNEIGPTSVQLPPVVQDVRPLIQQQQPLQINNPAPYNTKRLVPNLPSRFLLAGPRRRYLELGVPLYEASLKCDWEAAKAILDKIPNLLRYSITENGETALHVAASAKVPILGEVFVKNLVKLMNKEDLALENENYNTALYLAAAAGNFHTVKIMVEKNRDLVAIPGGGGQMLPLYAAALFGNYEVVRYLFAMSKDLCDEDGWNRQNRGWLLEKCVENYMFDIGLEIVKKYPVLGSGNVLALLARMPEAFRATESTVMGRALNQPSENKHPEPGNGSILETLDEKPEPGNGHVFEDLDGKPEPGNGHVSEDLDGKPDESSTETKAYIIGRTIKSAFAFIGSKVEPPIPLQMLRIIWEDIAKKPKNEIDRILRGPPDSKKQDSGMVVQAMQLQNLISEHIDKINEIRGQQDSSKQNTDPASGNGDQAVKLINLISKSLVSMHVETQNIIKEDNIPISGMAHQAFELQKLISENIVNMHDKIQKINEITGKGNQEALQLKRLQNVISDHIEKMKTESQKIIRRPARQKYSSRVVFIAAEMGNINFLVELIRQYPDLIWKVNDDKLSIFHIAVKHRHEGIYNLLYEIGAMKDMITPLRDPKENNMLHLAAQRAMEDRFQDGPGAAFQMQRDSLWFQEVRSMIPPSYRERKNQDGLTPQQLFTKEHRELVPQAEKWMKEIAAQCMVVAALIATMVFAAAFTVPGGYDQNNGIPILHSKLSFKIFVVADAISLLSSTASILYILLSVFTSGSDESDFFVSVPKTLMLGLAYLFFSLTSMMVAFSAGFFILYHKGLLWMPILICLFVLISFFIYVKVQYVLFVGVFRLSFSSRYLLKPKKHVLYYQNPKV